jgi:RimJ/RimL family protein N-acetyltransferase
MNPIVSRNIPRINGNTTYLSLMRNDDEAIMKYMEWMSDESTCGHINRNMTTVKYSEMEEWLNEKDKFRFGIVHREDDKLIGYCSINDVTLYRAFWLSINIGDAEYRGKGIGGEVMDMLLKYCFEELTAECVHLDVLETNIAAIKLYESRGMKVSGRYRNLGSNHGVVCDWLHMDIIREEYFSMGTE